VKSCFHLRLQCVVTLLALAVVVPAASPALAEEPVSFNRDVRPILAEACFACHGPDPAARQAELRFDREEAFFTARGDESDAVAPVVPGNPAASPLYQRITSTDPDTVMPPPDAHKQLKPAEKEIIRRWIAGGAKWQPHWSFIAPRRPAPPQVKDNAWPRNPIDRFVRAKLEGAGLKPAPDADPTALCRRLYLDLTGLPPTPEQVDEFVAAYSPSLSPSVPPSSNNAGSKDQAGGGNDAYEALVDKLLASPQYGEHRARYWLDAARYADTHGMHFDNYREMWPYRDWVVNAFNANQPFDQFTLEQIAGDLLPNPTVEQRIATGFHRCNITTNEGGTIDEENLANYARDRVETTAWVWLGLTANCCVCHDHKFDPLTARDFYAMSAYFRNTTQGPKDGNVKDTKPVLFLPQPADAPRYRALAGEIAAAESAVEAQKKQSLPVAQKRAESIKPDELEISTAGLVAYLPLDEGEGVVAASRRAGGKPGIVRGTGEAAWDPKGKLGPAPIVGKGYALDLGDLGDFERDQPFAVSLWAKVPEKLADGVLIQRARADGKSEAWKLALLANGKLRFVLQSTDGREKIDLTTRTAVAKPGQWYHFVVTYNGTSTVEGLRFYVNGADPVIIPQDARITASTRGPGRLIVAGKTAAGEPFTGGTLQDVRVYDRQLSADDARTLYELPELIAAARTAPAKRTADQKAKLATFSLEYLDPAYGVVDAKLQKLNFERQAIEARRIAVTHVQEEKMDMPAMANILVRGQYDKLGEKVTPGVFGALHPLPKDAPPNRMGLARWLVDPHNPLTARVTVNRFWQEVFGTGLVKTSEDFGIMGELPSHPELLDWLAVEFRESGWDVKHMFRQIVTSAAYRQGALLTAEKRAKDPENRLLSRGPRFRMDAEMIRDYALSVSRTLSPRRGGPGVKPYQPEGLWDIVGLPGGNTRDYVQDHGEGLYRRSLYTFWKRMSPPPNMETLNAPSREFSCLRRERTNTPLQALITLNDPQFVEAARNLAQRVLRIEAGAKSKPSNHAARIDLATQLVLCRRPTPAEADSIESALEDVLRYYRSHPDDASNLIRVGETRPDASLDAAELAAWTTLCNGLLNLDEALNK